MKYMSILLQSLSFFNILVLISIFFSFLIIILFISLIFTKIKHNRFINKVSICKKKYQILIYDFLSHKISIEEVKLHIEPRDEEFLRSHILSMLSILEGELSDRLVELFLLLGFIDGEIKKLHSSKWLERLEGCHNLSRLHFRKAQPALIKLLKDSSSAVQIAAFEALATIMSPNKLIHLLDLPHISYWNLSQVVVILTKYHNNLFREVEQLIKIEKNKKNILFYIHILNEIKDPRSVKLMLNFLDDPNETVKLAAIEFFSNLPHSEATPKIIKFLSHPSHSIRTVAAKTLGCSNDLRALDPLSRVLSDHNWNVRYSAAISLATMGEKGEKILSQKTQSPILLERDISMRILKEKDLEVINLTYLSMGEYLWTGNFSY